MGLGLGVLALIILAPLLALGSAVLRGLLLCIPVAIVSGQVAERLPFVPDLNVSTSFFVVVLLSLLIPTGGVSTKSD